MAPKEPKEPKKPDALPLGGNVAAIPAGRMEALLTGDVGKMIAKTYGKNALLPASKNPVLTHKHVIPTGIYSLDVALGGGVPVGLVSSFYGPKSTGKTVLVLKTIAMAQKLCRTCFVRHPCGCADPKENVCALIDVEGTCDLAWARKLGVDVDHLLFAQPDNGEAAIDIIETLIRSANCDLVGLDSIAFLQPKKETDRDVGDGTPGSQARLMTDAARRITSALNEQGNLHGRRPTMLTVNQQRNKIGVVFGDPLTTAGGQAVGYMNAVEVRTSGTKVTMTDVPKDSLGKAVPLYINCAFTVTKSKVTAPRQEGEYRLFFSPTEYKRPGDTADEFVMLADAELFGLLDRKGATWHLLDRTFPARGLIEPALLAEPAFRDRLYTALMALQIA